MSDRPDLDICTCGDFRRDHKHGVGGCLLPFCAQHGMPQCRAFTFANAVTESDRLYQESIEARRPLPVSPLLSARQETIHRDPGAARAARSVKVSDKLPGLPKHVHDAITDLWNQLVEWCEGKADDATRELMEDDKSPAEAALRLSIAKAIRDAEERAIKRCAVFLRSRGMYSSAMEIVEEAKEIRSIPLENA